MSWDRTEYTETAICACGKGTIVMLVMSVSAGVYYFVNELEKRDGYILKYIVAVIIGICGNFAGLLFSLIGCLIVYVASGIIKWFVG